MKKILIIEDEADILESVLLRLDVAGFLAIGMSDGQAGLEAIKREKPDLILLDLSLPKLNGEQVCEMVKKDTMLADIPIIIFTAAGNVDIAEKIRVLGARDYVAKPFDHKDLLAKIQALL